MDAWLFETNNKIELTYFRVVPTSECKYSSTGIWYGMKIPHLSPLLFGTELVTAVAPSMLFDATATPLPPLPPPPCRAHRGENDETRDEAPSLK